jgi:drug/metabolite transporter (DMT)-like permease
MIATSHPRAWKVLLAFAIIYFVWGSTFLAIRIGVREVPPFLLAGLRFLIAGAALYLWMRGRGTPSPTPREWRAVSLLAVQMFVLDYGLLFWAEQRVASGVAAVMMATTPVFMSLGEIFFLRTQRLTLRLAFALLVGIAGVAVLARYSPFGQQTARGEAPIDDAGALALIVAAISWSVASLLSRKMHLPAAKAMSSGAQMLAGGVMLLVTSTLLGEFRGFHPQTISSGAWLALAYLTVAGSIVAFTAYTWLLHHESPTKVGTYAYVNPVVAVVIGYFLGGETIGPRTIAGTLLVLVSVVVITRIPAKETQPAHEESERIASPRQDLFLSPRRRGGAEKKVKWCGRATFFGAWPTATREPSAERKSSFSLLPGTYASAREARLGDVPGYNLSSLPRLGHRRRGHHRRHQRRNLPLVLASPRREEQVLPSRRTPPGAAVPHEHGRKRKAS